MNSLINHFQKQVSIAPLVMFRIIFGLLVFCSTARFLLKGWVFDLYIKPNYFFSYYGFTWVKPFNEWGMYLVFLLMLIASVGIILGLYYRASTVLFFFLFTYVELIDKTNYLNHYYFVSLISFLLILVPAGRYFSLDTRLRHQQTITVVPYWCIAIFKFQLAIVYLFAGIAKLNYNWLIEAQPLANWLKHQSDLPLVGGIMKHQITAYLFAWGGALYDLSIPFLLLSKRWRPAAYILVIVFHVLTAIMFPIGVFPFVMIGSTLIFFSPEFHQKCISLIARPFNIGLSHPQQQLFIYKNKILGYFLLFYIFIQVLVPFRYIMYPGKLFWSEQGFRFSWRVMLIEKVGYAEFSITDDRHQGKMIINNADYLTPQQEKMMATQPDMILQYAHYLRDTYKGNVVEENDKIYTLNAPIITVNSTVSLFNTGSKVFIDPNVDLATIKRGWHHKNWVLHHD